MRNEIETYPLNEIKEIEIIEKKDEDGDEIYYVEMKLQNNKSVLLSKKWLRDKQTLQKMIDEIKDFIK